MEHIGHKHIIFNALKECVVEQGEYSGWKETLNAVLSLIGKTEYRKRYVARCVPGITPYSLPRSTI